MREMFGWVDFFSKLAGRIDEEGPEELNERAKRIDWRLSGRSEGKGPLADEPLFGVDDVDPLTFFSYLATRTRYPDRLPEALANVGAAFDVGESVEDCGDWKVLNVFNLLVAWARLAKDRELLWTIFRQAVAGQMEADTFRTALELQDVALPTLSTILFLVNPRSFLPLLDAPQYRHSYGLSSIPPRMPWSDYSAELERIGADHPGCEFFEIEFFHRLMRGADGRGLVARPDRCWLVSTNAAWGREVKDHWSEFSDNHWVRVEEKETYPVEKPEPGDLLLVRYGRGHGRGTGIVYRNDYKEGWSAEGRIHALWVNKEQGPLGTKTRAAAFAEASGDEVRSFRECSSYAPTWEILDRITYRREIEVALAEDETQLGDVHRLLKTKKSLADIKRTIDNAYTINKARKFLLAGRVTENLKPAMRQQVASRVKGFADTNVGVTDSTRRLLSELVGQLHGLQAPNSDRKPIPNDAEEPRHIQRIQFDSNRILYGPPGTGKTYSTVSHALEIVDGATLREVSDQDRQRFRDLRFKVPADSEESEGGQIAMVTFHQNYAYEDFVEGIRPKLTKAEDDGRDVDSAKSGSTELLYELRHGIFRSICQVADDARKNAEKYGDEPPRYVLVIDEINRGNIPKIFGELITLIEPSRRLGADDETTVALPYSGDNFGVPDNLYIIGTMNTADRSIQQMDTALRRRFTFVEMMPDAKHDLISEDVDSVNCRKMLRAMNERIALLLDREHQIGHTYLMNVTTMDQLADTCRNRIFPLLQEYFYDDWRKIRAVLGKNAFVQEHKTGDGYTSALAEELGVAGTQDATYERLGFSGKEWKDAGEYRKIYEEGDHD